MYEACFDGLSSEGDKKFTAENDDANNHHTYAMTVRKVVTKFNLQA
jgi:hypothetical protein